VLDVFFVGDQPMDRCSRFPRIEWNSRKSRITRGQNLSAATLQIAESVKGEAVGETPSAVLLFTTEPPACSINSGAIYKAAKWTKPDQTAGELCPRFVARLGPHNAPFYHEEVQSAEGGNGVTRTRAEGTTFPIPLRSSISR